MKKGSVYNQIKKHDKKQLKQTVEAGMSLGLKGKEMKDFIQGNYRETYHATKKKVASAKISIKKIVPAPETQSVKDMVNKG